VRLATEDAFDVREFFVSERLSGLFEITLLALCANPAVDFEAAVGRDASFTVLGFGGERTWSGICRGVGQVGTDESGRSTYRITIVPKLWLATQRRNYRVFQQQSEPEIVRAILADWDIEPTVEIDEPAYRSRKYRVQYGESDFRFVCRLLEDAGISFYFDPQGGESTLVLSDEPQSNPQREPALPFHGVPPIGGLEYATAVEVDRSVQPGRYTLRDHDYRREPTYPLLGSSSGKGVEVEQGLERFHYVPGAFLFGAGEGGDTPAADDKGKSRALEGEGSKLAEKRLDAKRGLASRMRFSTNALDLGPGMVIRIVDHPRSDVTSEQGLLVVESSVAGTHEGEWVVDCEVQSADRPYRPPLDTPKPKALGVESATVVGPAGEEIHCDEFGRVRVHFHWDRQGAMDDGSSCWIHVAQSWAGAGFGGLCLPRVGQEVLVQFLAGDPDRPVIVGRVFNNLQKVPYKLPDHKTQSGWKTCSTKSTGGYNEIAFEDEAGEEFIRIQAERDYDKLVKRDENVTVGRDRTALVQAHERLTVGRSYSKQVSENERHVTGTNLTVEVGANRTTSIAESEAITIGKSYSLSVGRGGAGTAVSAQQEKIVLTTGQGATLILEGGRIHLQAEAITLESASPIVAKPSVDEGG
jgi:type VI secretion system secreted protein VgrG